MSSSQNNLDFRGRYHTRAGFIAQVEEWDADHQCFIGTVRPPPHPQQGGSPTPARWNANGNHDPKNEALDLIRRVQEVACP